MANLMRAVIVLWLGFAVGCEEDSGVQAKGVSSGKKRDAGQVEPDAGGLEGADASEPMGDPGAPEVRLLTPQSASDPNTDEVVTEASVGVRCRVSAGDAQLDPDSIRIELLDEAGEAQEVPEVESLSDEEFLARFQLAERPNGPLSFRCSASDVDGREGWDEVDTFLDLGPELQVLSPQDNGGLTPGQGLEVRVRARPAPLAEGDEGAVVDAVHVGLGDERWSLTPDAQDADVYTRVLEQGELEEGLQDGDSLELLISATNRRVPEPVTRSERVTVLIDGEGPRIEVHSPGAGSVVRGEVQLQLSVRDTSEVDPGDVELRALGAAVGDGFELIDGLFVTRFDSRALELSDSVVELTISAQDAAGNRSVVQHRLRVDNVAPRMELDPAPIREWSAGTGDMALCSEAFDPVGEDAVDDLGDVVGLGLFRVLAEDYTEGEGADAARLAPGVDPDSIVLHAQAGGVPLLRDQDGDGTCDGVDTDPGGSAEAPLSFGFEPVERNGAPYFAAAADFASAQHSVPATFSSAHGACASGSEAAAPSPLCAQSTLYRVVPASQETKPAAVFAYQPTNAATGACHGEGVSLAGLAPGWVCVAATGADMAGNNAVSLPLRVCLGGACSGAPPSCSDGCSLPQGFGRDRMLLRQ